jgi:hypothetical protein
MQSNNVVEITRRYTISQLIADAEEQILKAQHACDANEDCAGERLKSWSETLELLHIMKESGVPDSLKD